jgi:ribosome maturation factor RimP
MDNRLEILSKALEPVLTKEEIVIDSIEYVKEGTFYFLRIVLDKINGIDLDTIVKATNLINPVVDELDLFEESYILDVLSKERE